MQKLKTRVALKVTNLTATAAIASARLVCKWGTKGVKYACHHWKEIAGTAVGVATGTAKVIHATSGHLISKKKLAAEVEAINEQSRQYQRLSAATKTRIAEASKDRAFLLDTLIVGGATMATHLNFLPQEIKRAYEMAYPNVSALKSFEEQVDSLGSLGLIGFASGIKGKLFEMQYVDYLNDGNLEDGFIAALSPNPVNPGWDIAIYAPDGEINNLMQAKATDSVAYVLEALRKNPQIDV